jgi:hypothetical protein
VGANVQVKSMPASTGFSGTKVNFSTAVEVVGTGLDGITGMTFKFSLNRRPKKLYNNFPNRLTDRCN